MSVLSVSAPRRLARCPDRLRFGSQASAADASIHWTLRRHGSVAPRQLALVYAILCLLSLAIAAAFWRRGSLAVLPFAGLELLGVGAAFLVYARHATDRESLILRPGRLLVQWTHGRRTESAEFAPAWVRVEPKHGDRSLVELSGQGRRISVGRFVRPELRRALADELRTALRRYAGSAT